MREKEIENELQRYMKMSTYVSKRKFVCKEGEIYYFVNLNEYNREYISGEIYFLPHAGYLFYTIDTNKNKVFIIDIISKVNRKGLATGSLKFLEEICKKNNVKKIYGELSRVDQINILKSFYEKNGYEIYIHENSKKIIIGRIEKFL